MNAVTDAEVAGQMEINNVNEYWSYTHEIEVRSVIHI